MTDTPTQAPIVLRADITRDELRALKIAALEQNMTVQQYLATIIKERITA